MSRLAESNWERDVNVQRSMVNSDCELRNSMPNYFHEVNVMIDNVWSILYALRVRGT